MREIAKVCEAEISTILEIRVCQELTELPADFFHCSFIVRAIPTTTAQRHRAATKCYREFLKRTWPRSPKNLGFVFE